jgi:hypothetical protein
MKNAIIGTAGAISLLALAFTSNQATAVEERGHAVWNEIAKWEMNEGVNATVLRDSANNFDGHIGKRVTPNGRYHYFRQELRQDVKPQHIDYVPDNDYLDPSFSNFAVVVRFKWNNNRHDMNLVQKGQGNPASGLFKMKTSVGNQPDGHIKCLFRGEVRDSQVESYGSGKLNDGEWHTVQCERTSQGTTMLVDDRVVDQNFNQPGSISNNYPIAIGGNSYCSKSNLDCNYFWGKIDYVRWMD